MEKRLDSYENHYAEVQKYKGETPYEDCGGIYGYYQLLETLENPDDPQYEQMKEWTENHFTEPYDLKKVNARLKSRYLCVEKSKPVTEQKRSVK